MFFKNLKHQKVAQTADIPKMRYTHSKLGELSALGLGCLQSADQTIVNEALLNGVNFFVTAEAYGDDNQKMLGKSLSMTDKKIFIATKVGINFMGKTADEQFTQKRDQIRKSVEKCIALLNKKTLDLVGLHRLDTVHHVLNANGNIVPAWEIALDELINLQQEGLIKHIGLSEPTADQIERAMALAHARGTTIAAVESAYSVVTRRAETNGVKDLCDREGIIFIAYASVIRGLTDTRLQQLSSEDFKLPDEEFCNKVFTLLEMNNDFVRKQVDMFSKENIKHNVKYILEFQTCAMKYGVTPSQLALAWVQHKSAIPIPGSRHKEHIAEDIKSASLVEALVKSGAFLELEQRFLPGTFRGDPNPIAIAGALDSNSKELSQIREQKNEIKDGNHKLLGY